MNEDVGGNSEHIPDFSSRQIANMLRSLYPWREYYFISVN
jgi:hypothetical protein